MSMLNIALWAGVVFMLLLFVIVCLYLYLKGKSRKEEQEMEALENARKKREEETGQDESYY